MAIHNKKTYSGTYELFEGQMTWISERIFFHNKIRSLI